MQPDDLDLEEFTDEQLQTALERVGREARQAAFAARRSVMVIRDGRLVELHPDGTERILGRLPPEVNGGASE